MKTNVEIQYAFNNITSDEIERGDKDDLKEHGVKHSTNETLNL